MGQRIEVVPDTDAALGGRLDGRRAAAGERIEHDVAGPAVAGDERVHERGREAREVRAHGVEAVAPQARLVLPLGLDGQGGQGTRQLEGELTGGHSRTVFPILPAWRVIGPQGGAAEWELPG